MQVCSRAGWKVNQFALQGYGSAQASEERKFTAKTTWDKTLDDSPTCLSLYFNNMIVGIEVFLAQHSIYMKRHPPRLCLQRESSGA